MTKFIKGKYIEKLQKYNLIQRLMMKPEKDKSEAKMMELKRLVKIYQRTGKSPSIRTLLRLLP